jgi:hypothetical protein
MGNQWLSAKLVLLVISVVIKQGGVSSFPEKKQKR